MLNGTIKVNKPERKIEFILEIGIEDAFMNTKTENLFREIQKPNIKMSTTLALMSRLARIVENKANGDSEQEV